MTNAETIPQIAMFINESYMAQPPPAPWPPLPPPQAAQPAATSAPPPPPAHPPRLALATQPAAQAQQPPPPPAPTPAPLPAPTATNVSPSVHQICSSNPANYHAPQAQNSMAMFTLNQPPPMVPPDFDASRPPPPIPTHVNQHKRKLDSNDNGAGPSKTHKEGPEVQESFCDSCIDSYRRIDGYKMQMETLHNEEETQILIYKEKFQEYEMGRDILKSLVEPDMFRLFDDLIEGVQTPRESLINLNSGNSSFVSVPSTSRDDETQVARRLNPLGNYPNQSPDIINLVLETFKNSTAPEWSLAMDSSDTIRVGNNRTDGLNHLANGQKTTMTETTRYGVAPGYSGAGMVNQEHGAHALPTMANYSLAGHSGYGGAPMYVFSNVPSTSRDDETQVARRLNPLGNYPNQSPDIINLVLETFKNSTAPERSLAMDSSDTIRVGNNRTNGLNHLANGQKTTMTETTRYGVAPGYSGAGMVNQEHGAHALPTMANYSLAGHSGYGGAPMYVFSNVPSTSRDDETQVARRLNPLGNYPNQSPDIINLVLETFKNSTEPERSLAMDSSDTIRVGNNRTNGLNHLANGQKTTMTETTRYGVAPGYSGAGMVNQEHGAHALPTMANYSLAGPSGYGGAGPGLAPPPPATYPMYHPPPPNRHYYGQNTSAPNVSPNIHYNGANRAPVAGPSQGMQPATSPAALRPTQPNTPTYNQMGRHPQ